MGGGSIQSCKKIILGECLLISSVPGKALRTLVDIARLADRFYCIQYLDQSKPEKVREYDQEIPQLHTTSQPTAP